MDTGGRALQAQLQADELRSRTPRQKTPAPVTVTRTHTAPKSDFVRSKLKNRHKAPVAPPRTRPALAAGLGSTPRFVFRALSRHEADLCAAADSDTLRPRAPNDARTLFEILSSPAAGKLGFTGSRFVLCTSNPLVALFFAEAHCVDESKCQANQNHLDRLYEPSGRRVVCIDLARIQLFGDAGVAAGDVAEGAGLATLDEFHGYGARFADIGRYSGLDTSLAETSAILDHQHIGGGGFGHGYPRVLDVSTTEKFDAAFATERARALADAEAKSVKGGQVPFKLEEYESARTLACEDGHQTIAIDGSVPSDAVVMHLNTDQESIGQVRTERHGLFHLPRSAVNVARFLRELPQDTARCVLAQFREFVPFDVGSFSGQFPALTPSLPAPVGTGMFAVPFPPLSPGTEAGASAVDAENLVTRDGDLVLLGPLPAGDGTAADDPTLFSAVRLRGARKGFPLVAKKRFPAADSRRREVAKARPIARELVEAFQREVHAKFAGTKMLEHGRFPRICIVEPGAWENGSDGLAIDLEPEMSGSGACGAWSSFGCHEPASAHPGPNCDTFTNELLECFSHFSYMASGREYLVTGLKGAVMAEIAHDSENVFGEFGLSPLALAPDSLNISTSSVAYSPANQFLKPTPLVCLCDPVVLSKDGRLASAKLWRGKTRDTGQKGIKEFFASHQCNRFCRALQLKCTTVARPFHQAMQTPATSPLAVPAKPPATSKHKQVPQRKAPIDNGIASSLLSGSANKSASVKKKKGG